MKKYRKNRVIRILSGDNDCYGNEVFTLDKNITSSILNKKTEGLEFVAKYNKNDNLLIETNPTRKIFSKSSFNFSINSINETNIKKENKDKDEELYLKNIETYEIRLKIPDKRKVAHYLENTVCAQYSNGNKADPKACVSWYDEKNFEVVCVCNKPGLIVNIEDKALANMSKMVQFPQIDERFCINIYLIFSKSILIGNSWILIFDFFYILYYRLNFRF